MPAFCAEDPVLVRVAGLPGSALRGLCTVQAFVYADDLVGRERELGRAGRALADVLHDHIGGLPAGSAKSLLVALRRALFQGRLPGGAVWNAAVQGALPLATAEAVAGWIDERTAWGRDRARLPGLVAESVDRRVSAVQQACADPGFRRALLQADPMLYRTLTRWLADGRRPPHRDMLRLVRYLARAAAKTSPFSTFAVTGLARWRPDGVAVRHLERGEPRVVLEVNRALVDTAIRLLLKNPAVAEPTRLRPSPSVTEVDEGLLFLGARLAEPLVTAPLTAELRACIGLARSGPTHAELAVRLATSTGLEPNTARTLIGRLVAAGLLEPVSPVPDHSTRPLQDLVCWLRGTGARDDVADLLADLDRESRREIPVAEPQAHAARQERLSKTLDGVRAALGVRTTSSGWRDTPFYDNAVFGRPVAELSRTEWSPIIDALDTLRCWFAVHDPALPLRLVLGDYLSDRFGDADVPFLVLHKAVQDEVARSTTAGREFLARLSLDSSWDSSANQRVRWAARLRERARRAVLDRQPDDDGVIRISPGELAADAAGWPRWIAAARSVSWYVQPAGTDAAGRSLVVFNAAMTGHGRGRSRWLQLLYTDELLGAAPSPARAGSASLPTASPLDAEIGGVFGSSLNLRAPWLAYEVDYPGAAGGRPAGRTIPLGDLMVRRDRATGLATAFSPTLGAYVRPHHVGMMADHWLPPAACLLRMAFTEMCSMRAGFLLAFDRSRSEAARRPRIQIGPVILQRRRWSVPAEQVPIRGQGEEEDAYLLRLVAWARDLGLPRRFFLRTPGRHARAGGLDWLLTNRHKPFFVDLAAPLLVEVMQRLVTRTEGSVTLEEALPDPADELDRVVELLVETRGAGD